jgi:hypothetical protein
MRVRAMNCDIGTAAPCTVSKALGIGAGTSPSGKTKLLPGSNATIALTLLFLIAVSQPSPPPQANRPGAAMPPSMIAGGTAAVVTV